MHAPTPESRQEPNNRRTRRNVIAMTGILASIAGTVGVTSIAHAMGRMPIRTGTRQCFLSGTKIQTDVDETAIENLGVGDVVSTASGHRRVIKRIISWQVEREPNQDWTDDVAPIKICRSALAPNVPCRDLYLSPAHAVYRDGMLINVSGLVNGRSIVRCSKGDEKALSYFHLELEDHQVIFAEGAPVESALGDQMIPLAPRWLGGRRSQLASRLRSAISPWADRRKAVDRLRDSLEARGDGDIAA
jgi:Hint domain